MCATNPGCQLKKSLRSAPDSQLKKILRSVATRDVNLRKACEAYPVNDARVDPLRDWSVCPVCPRADLFGVSCERERDRERKRERERECVCVCVSVCVRGRVCVCVRERESACSVGGRRVGIGGLGRMGRTTPGSTRCATGRSAQGRTCVGRSLWSRRFFISNPLWTP